jgi:hypothetical protein
MTETDLFKRVSGMPCSLSSNVRSRGWRQGACNIILSRQRCLIALCMGIFPAREPLIWIVDVALLYSARILSMNHSLSPWRCRMWKRYWWEIGQKLVEKLGMGYIRVCFWFLRRLSHLLHWLSHPVRTSQGLHNIGYLLVANVEWGSGCVL